MDSEWEHQPGQRFIMTGDSHEWSIDRHSGRVRVTRRSSLGGPKERTIPLDDLLGVTILLSDTPPMSFASVVRTLATAYDMAKSGATSPEPWVATLPKGLFVRLDERSDGDHVRQTELAFALDGIDDERGMVAIAYRIADG
jgi:hypothetical protein